MKFSAYEAIARG